MPRWCAERLIRYGDSMDRNPAGCGDLAVRAECGVARILDGDGARLQSG